MQYRQQWVAMVLSFALLYQFTAVSRACGPESLQPVYEFTESPDPPFKSFVRGNIGIIKNTFGRKTLFIAYRYLQGGSFTDDEQQALIQALKGKPPEENDDAAIKTWIKARQAVVTEDTLPEIYVSRRDGNGYDFFPNCTANAFEVAVQTLNDRVARFGKEDPGVKEWLRGQDQVFSNCGATASAPTTLGAESPAWLRKDRDYQIGAALFYQTNFEGARAQFEKIGEDIDSPWQQTARYLVARTLVREASLKGTPETQKQLYERAELYLMNHPGIGGAFQNATMRMLGLVKYRLHPEERVRELAQVLAGQSGNENLRQDLIDYTWLLDKFDQQTREAEEERKKQAQPQPSPTPAYQRYSSEEEKREAEAIESGELIRLWLNPYGPDGKLDYQNIKTFVVPHDITEAALLAEVEGSMGRKLSPKESDELKDRHKWALEMRRWQLSPNRKWSYNEGYEGCNYSCDQYDFDLTPAFLRLDELSDWIVTFQSDDPKALQHAKSKWKETQSAIWLVATLSKAQKTTPGIQRLLIQAENIPTESPAFSTLAYHRVRLNIELGKKLEARKLLDQIMNTQFESLPISSQNEFLKERMSLSDSFSEFLRFAVRKPVVFYQYGTFGSIAQILDIEKEFWSEGSLQTKEEFDADIAAEANELLPWQERFVFDDETVERMNWYFTTAQLLEASRDQSLPDYLRRQFLVTAWTRSFLLGDEVTARKTAPDVMAAFPEMSELLRNYIEASSHRDRERAGLFAMLKFPNLTPYIVPGIPRFTTSERLDYYFEQAWWCPLDETDYDDEGNEKPRKVENPGLWNGTHLAAIREERAKLKAIGSAKSFLGKRVLAWAKETPDDPRIPEALFIAIKANESYKYGCDSWEHDEKITKEADTLLREKYSGSAWTAKLQEAN